MQQSRWLQAVIELLRQPMYMERDVTKYPVVIAADDEISKISGETISSTGVAFHIFIELAFLKSITGNLLL